jgi:hypothetical protein
MLDKIIVIPRIKSRHVSNKSLLVEIYFHDFLSLLVTRFRGVKSILDKIIVPGLYLFFAEKPFLEIIYKLRIVKLLQQAST